MNENLRIEKRILRISMAGSIAFLIAEVLMAYFTGSHAVLMDCVYDLADLIMIGPFLVLVPLLYKPVTERRPYGFSQVESLFVIVKCTLLMGVTISLIIESITMLFHGGNTVNATVIAFFEMGVSVTCIIMYLTLNRLNKKYSSPAIMAELYIWKLDSMTTMGVGLAFLIQVFVEKTSFAWIAPYIDPAIAAILATFLLKEPFSMVIDALRSLVLFAPNKEVVAHIREVAESCLSKYGYTINFLDVMKTGRKLWVGAYILQEGELLHIGKLKSARQEMMEILKKDYDSIYIYITPEIEEPQESVSLTENSGDSLEAKEEIAG